MTLQSLPALPAAAVTPLVEHACASLGEAAVLGLAMVTDEDLTAGIEMTTVLMRRAESLRLVLLAQAQRRRLADQAAAAGTDAWAAALTGDRREMLAGGLRIARLLAEKYDATRVAFATGRLSLAHTKIIVDAAEQAPVEATATQVRQAQELLVARATGDARGGRPMSVRGLRNAARRMLAFLDRDLADRHEAILLGREHRDAQYKTYLMCCDNGDGTWTGKFQIPELHGQMLTQALQRLTAPRRLNSTTTNPTSTSPTSSGASGHDLCVPAQGQGSPNIWETHGAAFCELIEHLPTTGYAANSVTLLITTTLDHLRTELGSAGLDTGIAITASEARRLACNAHLIPHVLGGDSIPLDQGRTRRLHTPAQRMALRLSHDSCAIETCDRPFAWCEIHHPHPWSKGGKTDLDNALPLCGHHHRKAHDHHYTLQQEHGGWRLNPTRTTGPPGRGRASRVPA